MLCDAQLANLARAAFISPNHEKIVPWLSRKPPESMFLLVSALRFCMCLFSKVEPKYTKAMLAFVIHKFPTFCGIACKELFPSSHA